MTVDPHATLRQNVIKRVLDGAGIAAPSQRRVAFDRKGVPPELQALIDKVEAHAYKVTDDDLRELQGKYSDDELFEIIVSAALGASERRLIAGLEALDEA
jgi:hypothetical protein